MLRKILRRSLKVFLGLLACWILVHLIENWRGRRAWENWQAAQEKRGAHYQIEALIPPLMPDSDNFAKAPVVASAIKGNGRLLGEFTFGGPSPLPPGWSTGHTLDFRAWSEINKTNDLETRLAEMSEALVQISEAAKRKGCRFDLPRNDENYTGTQFLGFLAPGRVLTIRSLLHLRSGRADAALQDALTGLRIIRHLSSEPDLIAVLSQLNMSGLAMQPVWEGLETHAWNDSQLASLQDELSKIDELKAFLLMGQAQRISAANFYGKITSGKWWAEEPSIAGKAAGILGLGLIPRGWMYRNWCKADEYFANTWLQTVDPSKHRIYPDRAREVESWWEKKRGTPYTFFAKTLTVAGPGMAAQAHRFAERQLALDEAFIVCGLERYRLDHEDYPDSLQVLVPAYADRLPDDVFSDGPLRYKRTGRGSFLLYSVGWNGMDEGGQMAFDHQSPPRQDWEKGDWPWPSMRASEPMVHK